MILGSVISPRHWQVVDQSSQQSGLSSGVGKDETKVSSAVVDIITLDNDRPYVVRYIMAG